MKVNSAVANKMLKKITEEYEALKVKEAHSKTFLNGDRSSVIYR